MWQQLAERHIFIGSMALQIEQSSDNEDQHEKVLSWYRAILRDLRGIGFEPSPAESVFLRQSIQKCFDKNEALEQIEENKESMDYLFTFPEIIERFFFHYYGVNYYEYFRSINIKYRKEAMRGLCEYIQEKLRKEMELM